VHVFDYVRAESVEHAVELLADSGGQARPLVGGTDVLVQLRAGRRRVDRLVDLKLIPETDALEVSDAGLTRGLGCLPPRVPQREAGRAVPGAGRGGGKDWQRSDPAPGFNQGQLA
jgi:hypothetical protein